MISPDPSGAKSPDLLRLMRLCRRLLSERGAANGAVVARDLSVAFSALPPTLHRAFFTWLAQKFNPDPGKSLKAAQAYAQAPTAVNLIRLGTTIEPPRQELFRRLNRVPGGTAVILAMRRALLPMLKTDAELQSLEADLLHLLSSWFNPGFLQLQRVDWSSPAALLEQIIHHEAVHAIDGWDDLRRRLQPDRRCFAFFHPQLAGEPLIFVEVALLTEMPAAIAPLIDKGSEPLAPSDFKVAAFYSISNCQPGLRSVSLGNFLIKRVAEELKRELPQLSIFCTLSPVSGFSTWLKAQNEVNAHPTAQAHRLRLVSALGGDPATTAAGRPMHTWPLQAQQALLALCAYYLSHQTPESPGDPVARFHLDNGARLERINWAADLSPKTIERSFGLMVNYVYDLRRIERYHEEFLRHRVAHSATVEALLATSPGSSPSPCHS